MSAGYKFPNVYFMNRRGDFTPNGVFNSKNFVLWQEENPHAVRQNAFQYRWAINVWAGIIANRVVNSNTSKKVFLLQLFLNIFIKKFLISPYFLPPRHDRQTYAEF